MADQSEETAFVECVKDLRSRDVIMEEPAISFSVKREEAPGAIFEGEGTSSGF